MDGGRQRREERREKNQMSGREQINRQSQSLNFKYEQVTPLGNRTLSGENERRPENEYQKCVCVCVVRSFQV